jgi:hypothetical protein
MEVKEGADPRLRIRIRIRTGAGCDLTVKINNTDFAVVGPNSDETFILTS